jgi:dihydrofolate reductase
VATYIAKNYKISVIAAIGKNRELGFKNRLVWSLPNDLKRFKTITSGHPVVMGLNTYHSISKPLPNRTNIVLSANAGDIPGVVMAKSIDEALEIGAQSPGGEEVFVIGGGQVFSQMISKADKLYLTLVDEEAEADVFFPDFSMFTKKVFEESHEEGGIKYTWVDLER